MCGLMESGEGSPLRLQPLCALVPTLRKLRLQFRLLRGQHSNSFNAAKCAFYCQQSSVSDDMDIARLWSSVFKCRVADLTLPTPAALALATINEYARAAVEAEFAAEVTSELLHDHVEPAAVTVSPASLQVIRYIAGYALRYGFLRLHVHCIHAFMYTPASFAR